MKSTTASMLATFALLLATPALAQESSRADFDEFCKMIQGRWVGDMTLTADWPGLGEKGDKVQCYAEIKTIEDGNALLGRFYGGNGSSTWITIYDYASKQIKETMVTSGGSSWTKVWYKDGAKWVGMMNVSNPDQRAVEGKDVLAISDSGNKHSYYRTISIDAEPSDIPQSVWVRVSDK